MDISEGAKALELPESEVDSVDDTIDGPVVTTTDGQRYVIVPSDEPDGAGQTGVMYLRAPSDVYGGTMAVFVPRSVEEAEVAAAPAPKKGAKAATVADPAPVAPSAAPEPPVSAPDGAAA